MTILSFLVDEKALLSYRIVREHLSMGVVIRADVVVIGRVLYVALVTQRTIVRKIAGSPAAKSFTLKHYYLTLTAVMRCLIFVIMHIQAEVESIGVYQLDCAVICFF